MGIPLVVYYDGNEVGRDTTSQSVGTSPKSGHLVLGRSEVDNDDKYASVMIDELVIKDN